MITVLVMRRWFSWRLAGWSLLVLILLWISAAACLYRVMTLSPDRFGRVMAHVPSLAFMVLPFETLWMEARAGSLHPGDPAPDFSLQSLNGKERIQLSLMRGQMPVVLVFGSYT